MKKFQAMFVVLVASLLVSAFSFAAEPEVQRHMEIKIAADDEMVSFDADLKIGETRQSFTDSGKEVLVTRTEGGFQLEVEGKDIDIDMPHGKGHHAMFNMTGDEDKKVIIHKLHGDSGEQGYHFIHADEGADIVIEHSSAADRMAESGVLDDLDEAKRQEILSVLRDLEPEQIHKQVRVMVEKIHREHAEDH